MKIRSTFFMLAFLLSYGSMGQISEGIIQVQDLISWNWNDAGGDVLKEQTNRSLLYTPNGDVFLSDHFMFGGGLMYRNNVLLSDGSRFVENTYGVNLNFRIYLTPPREQIAWFAGAKGGYERIRSSTFGRTTFRPDPWFTMLFLGADFFISEGLSITSKLDIRFGETEGDLSKYRQIGLSTGIRFYFLAKKDRSIWSIRTPRVGDWMIGGTDFRFDLLRYSDRSSQSIKTISMAPRAGAFVAPYLMAGTSLLFTYQNFNDTRFYNYGFQPFVRYYLGEMEQTTRLFIEAEIGMRRVTNLEGRNSSFSASGASYSFNALNYGGAIGANVFLTPNFAMEIAFSYDRLNYSQNVTEPTKSKAFNFVFGFQYFLTRQPKPPGWVELSVTR